MNPNDDVEMITKAIRPWPYTFLEGKKI